MSSKHDIRSFLKGCHIATRLSTFCGPITLWAVNAQINRWPRFKKLPFGDHFYKSYLTLCFLIKLLSSSSSVLWNFTPVFLELPLFSWTLNHFRKWPPCWREEFQKQQWPPWLEPEQEKPLSTTTHDKDTLQILVIVPTRLHGLLISSFLAMLESTHLSDLNGWLGPFFSLNEHIFPETIKEFYSNLTFADNELRATSLIKGRKVKLSPEYLGRNTRVSQQQYWTIL